MKNSAMLLVGLAFCLGTHAEVQAQVPYVTYYQPVVVYRRPVVVYRHPVVVARPPVVVAPRAVYYAPAPVPVVYQPTVRVRTRYRPILGGTVSRVRYGYAPAYYAPAPVVTAY